MVFCRILFSIEYFDMEHLSSIPPKLSELLLSWIMLITKRIKEIMKEKAINRAELARRSTISKGHISHILNENKPNLELDTIRRIAYALGVSLTEIIDDDSLLLEFSLSEKLSYDEYVSLTNSVPDRGRPTTLSGWKELYDRLQIIKYQGLSQFVQRMNLKWDDIKQLIVNSRKITDLPQTPSGWEDLYNWNKTFGTRLQ